MSNKIYYIIIIIFIFLFFNNHYLESFKSYKKCFEFQHNKKCFEFQHNKKYLVSKESYLYVYQVRQQLLYNIDRLLNKLNIKYVISHGNLIEYIRNRTIYHDDDIDIRMDINDLNKWKSYCNNLNSLYDYQYNLKYDDRIFNINQQKYNGIQVWLIKFNNKNKIKEFNNMDIHGDLVFNMVDNKFWDDYKIDFNNIKPVKYLGVNTYIPNINDTNKVLENGYGKNFIIPNYNLYEIYNYNQCSNKYVKNILPRNS